MQERGQDDQGQPEYGQGPYEPTRSRGGSQPTWGTPQPDWAQGPAQEPYGAPQPSQAGPQPAGGGTKKSNTKLGCGCLGVVAIVIIVIVAVAVSGGSKNNNAGSNAPAATTTTPAAAASAAAAPATTQAAPPPPAPTVLFTKSGEGQLGTRSFTVDDDWSLTYTFDCSNFGGQGNFQVYEDYPNGNVLVNSLATKGGDTTYQTDDAGTHTLEVNSECDWTIKVTNDDTGQ